MAKQLPDIDLYTQRYEYACALINDYISRESMIAFVNKTGDIYEQGSLVQWIFTTDYSAIYDDKVLAEITKKLTKASDINARQYQMPLTRLKSTYVDMCAALGMTFVEQLTKNIVKSLAAISGKQENIYSNFFKAWPFVIVAVIGSKVYTHDMFMTHHRAELHSQIQNKSATVL